MILFLIPNGTSIKFGHKEFEMLILEIKSQRETGAMSMWEITQNMSLLKLENLQLL